MFEESLVESSGLRGDRNRWPALVAMALQVSVSAILIILPLLHPELLPLRASSFVLHAPPVPRPPQPPPPTPRARAAASATSAPSAPPSPAEQPAHHVLSAHTDIAPPSADLPAPVSIGNGMANSSTVALSFMAATGTGASVSVAAPAAHPDHVTLSSGVTAGLLLAPIRPEYPPIAKASRQQGTVTIQAVISRAGTVESAHVVGGPLMLQGAALAAVEHAHYRPYLLNGQPTEVDTTITINFRLGS